MAIMTDPISGNDYKLLFDLINDKNIIQNFESKKKRKDDYTVEYELYPLKFVSDTKSYFLAFLKYLQTFKDDNNNQIQELIEQIKKIQIDSNKIRDPGPLMRGTAVSGVPKIGVDLLVKLNTFLVQNKEIFKVAALKNACEEYSKHLGDPKNDSLKKQKIDILVNLKNSLINNDPKKALDDFSSLMRKRQNVDDLSVSRDGYFKKLVKFILTLAGCNELIEKIDNKTVTGRFFVEEAEKLRRDVELQPDNALQSKKPPRKDN